MHSRILPLLFVAIPQLRTENRTTRRVKALFHDFGQGLHYAWSNRGIRFMLMTASIWSLLAFAPLDGVRGEELQSGAGCIE